LAFPARYPDIAAKRPLRDPHCSRIARPRIRVLDVDSGIRPPSNACTRIARNQPRARESARGREKSVKVPNEISRSRDAFDRWTVPRPRGRAGSYLGSPRGRLSPFSRGITKRAQSQRYENYINDFNDNSALNISPKGRDNRECSLRYAKWLRRRYSVLNRHTLRAVHIAHAHMHTRET